MIRDKALSQPRSGKSLTGKDAALDLLLKESLSGAELNLDALEEKWGKKYPFVLDSWRRIGIK